MRLIKAEPLTAEAFAPFGEVLVAPAAPGRDYFDDLLVNLRPIAGRPSLSFARIAPTLARPAPVTKIERHEFSNQAFIPLAPDFSYLVGVAPPAAGTDGPDAAALRVFLAAPGQAINYRAGLWHLPMQAIGGEARFAVVMFNDGGAADTELRDLPEPVGVVVPSFPG